MIYDNIEFHNTAELVSVGATGGLRIQRFPEALRIAPEINNRARFIMNQATGVELRFAAESYRVHLYLSADSAEFPILVFRGDYFVRAVTPVPGTIQEIALDLAAIPRFGAGQTDVLPRQRFSPDIWRIFLGRCEVRYHGIDAMGLELRPPRPDEQPSKKLLTYGSSITMGAGSATFYNAYAIQTGRILGYDTLNLGLGGACHAESAIADFIASRNDWDCAFFELGINMRSTFDVNVFEERARYLLKTICDAHPEKHIFLTTVYPNYLSFPGAETKDPGNAALIEREQGYNKVLETLAEEDRSGFLHLFAGDEILDDPALLNADVVHPSDTGHFAMAGNLARKIRPFLSLRKEDEQHSDSLLRR